jgi:glycosyltransferase involved in cell wall biosynthesis
MKILYDYQMFNTQNVGGITRYFYELISHFDQDNSISWEIPIKYSSNLYLKKHPAFSENLSPNPLKLNQHLNVFSKIDFISEKLLYKIENGIRHNKFYGIEYERDKKLNIDKLKEGNFDIFHPTYFDDYFMNFIGDKPFVLTVHDLINQIFPEISLHFPIDKNQSMINRADRIITASASTKKDLINIFNVDENKVDVIHLANPLEGSLLNVSDQFKEKTPERYLLYVGGRWDYKNFLFFAQMFSSLCKEDLTLKVFCTGSPFNSSEQYLFNKLGIQDRFYNAFVSDDELTYLYTNAIAFVFPSMYEGFGLPVLEAFSCGCPAVISNSSSLSEIGEDAVIYFEPKNPGSMLQALKDVIENETLRKQKIAKGYEQLKKFSWKKTAMETKQVYNKIYPITNKADF